jgi:HYDIN/CFA65/VesB-like, Ig-like domain/Immunoglobulin I-set domain
MPTTGLVKASASRAIILTVLLCASGTAAHAQKKSTKQSGPRSHSHHGAYSDPTPTVTPPSITAQPASVTVLAGQKASFSVGVTGTTPLACQWYKNGAAIGGATSFVYTTSATATSDNGAQFTAVVSNSAGSATSGAALLTVNSPIVLLNSSSTNLVFGNVNVSSSSSQSVLLTNAGNSSVTISNVSVAGGGFNAGGGLSGAILSPGQTATLSATFAPATAGSVTGSVTVTSNASNSPMTIALSGTGVAPVTHSVSLSWTPSTSSVAGYNVYSSAISGGPYNKLTASPLGTTNYTDDTVGTSQTYYYVVTAVNSTNVESGYSAQATVIVP